MIALDPSTTHLPMQTRYINDFRSASGVKVDEFQDKMHKDLIVNISIERHTGLGQR
jgi:hypothetical protein